MNRINPSVDIIADLLKAVLDAKPDDKFCESLQKQYSEMGGLSKKQLEGLHGKATKFTINNHAKLATLEAIIRRKHQKFKSEKPAIALPEARNTQVLSDMQSILKKFPEHKRVLFLKAKWEKGEDLNKMEIDELSRFLKICL